MKTKTKDKYKLVLDLERLNSLNAEGCPGCGGKFSLGETVVLAQGPWDGGPKYIHEQEAVYDKNKCIYTQREKRIL